MAVEAVGLAREEPKRGGIRFLQIITESSVFKTFILICILANAVALGVMHIWARPTHGMIRSSTSTFCF